jgi:curli production assembly/transport component CsgG
VLALLAGLLVTGCAATPAPSMLAHRPEIGGGSSAQRDLADLPRPSQPIAVAVYGFGDQTGQFKPSDAGQSLSRAVSQGGTSILVKALGDAGQGGWFTVIEREHLDDLLKERQIIREMRAKYMGEDTINPAVLPPMLYAGVIFEGGIIGFDSNTLTGGAGAKFLGIGADSKYKQDTISIYLRAVSTKTGAVLASVVVRKSIASIGVQGDAFRFVEFKQLLEVEAGVTENEPAEFALQQAIQKAVSTLILEGAEQGLWEFADPAAGAPWLQRYDTERGHPLRLAAASAPVAQMPVSPRAAGRSGPVIPVEPFDGGAGPTAQRPRQFDPAAAATQSGSSGIATSAAGIAPLHKPSPEPDPQPTKP